MAKHKLEPIRSEHYMSMRDQLVWGLFGGTCASTAVISLLRSMGV